MADTWGELKLQFDTLYREHGEPLRAHWISTAWNKRGDHWRLAYSDTPRLHEEERSVLRGRFTALAERAAVHLGRVEPESALFVWLDLLRERKLRFLPRHGASATEAGIQEEYETGVIRELFQASADCCYQLETDALRLDLVSQTVTPQTASVAIGGNQRGAGRRADEDFNRRFVSVVEEFQPDWKDRLAEVCAALDQNKLPLTKSKKWKSDGCATWEDVCVADEEGLVKAIEHRIEWVSRHPIQPSDGAPPKLINFTRLGAIRRAD